MEKLIYKMDLGAFQEMAEGQINRELTETELKRLNYIFYDEGSFHWKVWTAFIDAINMAVDEKEDWSSWDKDMKDTSLATLFRWKEEPKEKSALENFQENIMQSFAKLYSQQLSEATKRGIQAKKEREKSSFEKGFDM